MKLRPFTNEDIGPISDMWEKFYSIDHGLPDRKTVLADGVVEHNGRVIGYGQLRLFAEATFFVDKDASLRNKISALRACMLDAFRNAEIAKLNEIYVFIKDPKYSALLQKHFHFSLANKPGQLLIKEL
jgi:hypothetical protein